MHFEHALDRWYIGAFLVIFGVTMIIRARQFASLRRFFKRDGCADILAVVDRRQVLEALPLSLWTIPGAIYAVVGVAVLAGLVTGTVAYGICSCAFAASLAFGYLRMRNSGVKRAALLEPRTATDVIPPLWYPIGIAQALAPLVFIADPSLQFAAACVSMSTTLALVVTCAANGMPSILTGDDIESELFVDQRLRNCRVKGLYGVTMGIPFVFMCMNYASVDSLVTQIAYVFVLAAWAVTILPLFLRVRVFAGA